MERTSARSRLSVAPASREGKLAGSLHLPAVSTIAIMSAGRRPKKKRATTSGVSAMPMRVNSSAATAAALRSLSTSTPLQSKMITLAPARSPPGVVDAAPQRIDMEPYEPRAGGKSRAASHPQLLHRIFRGFVTTQRDCVPDATHQCGEFEVPIIPGRKLV